MAGEDVFSRAPLDLESGSEREVDAELAALIQLYLRGTFDEHAGCWRGRDEHDTLRRTCHAVEVLHRLNLDAHTAGMVREAGNWLINLPIWDTLPPSERVRCALYPSRFKTLAYLGRFDDDVLRRDFSDLLDKEVGGMVRGVTESDVLTTSIALDTLITLERRGIRAQVCSDARFERIIAALRQQLKLWKPPEAQVKARPRPAAAAAATTEGATTIRPRRVAASEIDSARDLSYVFGLLLSIDRKNVGPRQALAVTTALTQALEERNRARGGDIVHALYAALQLAEHCRGDDAVQAALHGMLSELRTLYATAETPRRWDLMYHTLVLRLLLTYYGETALAQGIAAHFLRRAERQSAAVESTLEAELKAVIRERVEIDLGEVVEISGGFTDDRVFRVPFTYWHATPGRDGERHTRPNGGHEASLIIKRSTSDAFYTATENYRQLPPALRRLFVRQPLESQVHKSGSSSAYYLTMEDLASLHTFEALINESDQRAMSELHLRTLRAATALTCDAVFALFRETHSAAAAFPGTQIARLYLARIEGKLTRALARVPWLKNPLAGYVVSEQRYRALDSYLSLIAKHAAALHPRHLGLVHGDLHARNIMLDRACMQLKLIDLDKLSWSGDYLADLGNLLADVCVYRRVAAPERDFGLAAEEIAFVTRTESGTAENAVRYPALARPAATAFQQHLLAEIEPFAAETEDHTWRARLWLATATALIVRLAFQSRKEPAAVLYGEAVRLLHELTRHLEQGQELPPVPIPAAWPQASAARGAGAQDLPEWLTRHDTLRELHDGLLQLGLRAEIEGGTLSYAAPGGTTAVARLVAPRREGIARLLLPSDAPDPADAAIKMVRSGQGGDAFGTILILTEITATGEVIRAVRAVMPAPARVRNGRQPAN